MYETKQKKIAIIGPPGCGKSTLATELFVELKKIGKNVEHVTEWVRSDIHLNGPMKSISEQFRTRLHQMEIEDSIPKEVEWVVTDSGTLTPYFYAALYAKNDEPRERIFLADMFKYLLDDIYKKRYSYIFYLPMTQTYITNNNILNDGTRFQTEDEVKKLNRLMEITLLDFNNPGNIYNLDCQLEKRVEIVIKTLFKGEKE